MRKRKYFVYAAVMLVLVRFCLSAPALTEMKNTLCFVDSANVLSEATKMEIYNSNRKLSKLCDAQIAVVVLEDIADGNIGKYALGMGDLWGVGENGFLLLLTISNNDYHAYTGEGLAKIFPESTLQEMFSEHLEPNLFEGDYDAAVRGFFEDAFVRVARHYDLEIVPSGREETESNEMK